MSERELVLIIDFGSPYNQMLTREVRELGVYSELHQHTITEAEIKKINPSAIILSGGPYYVNDENKYRVDQAIFDINVPILGICYGNQLIVEQFGGKINHENERSYEEKTIEFSPKSKLTNDLPAKQRVLQSFGDSIAQMPTKFVVDAKDEQDGIVAISHETKPIYGIQFYPEVDTSEHGIDMLKNFLFTVAG